MTDVAINRGQKNRFAEEQARAGKLLEEIDNFDFLDEIGLGEEEEANIPFPYGPQPNRRVGWD